MSNILKLGCGLGTELERRGFARQMAKSRLWSARALVDNIELLRQIHYDQYAIAGANIVTSASYQASIAGFQRELHCSLAEAKKLLQSSIRVAKQARSKYINDMLQQKSAVKSTGAPVLKVAASCGSYGAYLADGSEFSGAFAERISIEELMAFHGDRLKVLLREDPDLIAFETIPSVKEVEAICRLLSERYPHLIDKSWISVSCRDGQSMNDGRDIRESVRLATSIFPKGPYLFAIGVNCTAPEFIPSLVELIVTELSDFGDQAKRTRVIVYPNSGEIWQSETHEWLPGTSQDFQSAIQKAIALGATIVGGCCRVQLEAIREIP